MTRNAHESVLEAVGGTPAVWLDRLCEGLPGRVLLKMESMNPSGSIKDRAALQCLREAVRSGALRPKMPVVELTSGNMGIGLAMACAVLGYRMIAVMSEGNSPERRLLLAAYGAEIELVPQLPDSVPGKVSGDDLALVEQRTKILVEELGAWRPDQFVNPANPLAHYAGTGAEIWDQSDGQVDAFVALVGTGGTFLGCAKALKERQPTIHCYAVEPEGSQVIAGLPVTNAAHVLQGGGYAMIPPQWDGALCDGTVAVSDGEATDTARGLARREGILAGYSTGANVAAALSLVREGRATAVATLAPDSGSRYLSSGLFSVD